MKLLSIISIMGIFLFTGCLSLKDKTVDKKKEKVRLIESRTISEKAPGDNVTVYLPYPLESPDRPKAQIKTYKGEKGAEVKVEFDSTGNVNRIDADCPEIDKVEQHNLELEYELRTRKMEKQLNIEAIREVGKWTAITLIPIGFFFAVAFYLRKKI